MKHIVIALICLAAFHALPEDAPSPEKLLRALQEEAGEKLWNQDEWRKIKAQPGQDTQGAFEAWQGARVEQWGMHFLVRYTDFIERYPKIEFLWQGKQAAHRIWWHLQRLKKPEYQKYLDDWKVRWPGDNVIERMFYKDRLGELAEQCPNIEDAEKIARTLMAEFPARREPYRALLSLARRKSAEAHETTLREILKNADTPETIKDYLQGKTGDAKWEDEPYDYRGERERGDKEIDHYEIRHAQLSRHFGFTSEDNDKINRALILEFPEQTRPYSELLFSASNRGGLDGARAWMLEFVKGPAPDTVKSHVQKSFWDFHIDHKFYTDFWHAMDEDTLPAPGGEKAWLEKYMPEWRMFLDAYADLVEGRLSCPEIERARSNATWLLERLSKMTANPDDWRHLRELNAKWLALPDWSEEGRVSLRRIQLLAQETGPASEQTVFGLLKDPPVSVYTTEVYEKVTQILLKEFPKQAEPYKDTLLFARRKGPLERTLLQDMLDSPAPASVKKT
ncbi:MAG: hypothetical protein LBW77_05740, partial [Verrucomicrobiota bacterium]|nr:hypothetical protein [Verrucomicrobiota bacterium]